MNKYLPHVYVLPEDDCDRQLADGFVLHDQVNALRIQVMPPAGGWLYVLQTFQNEYVARLRENPLGHVVMLIDFDGDYNARRAKFEQATPEDLKERVFVVGPRQTPEMLKNEMGKNFEEIGKSLADECFADVSDVWDQEQLKHNDSDRKRLFRVVKPILFAR